jgi:hypothetical protein
MGELRATLKRTGAERSAAEEQVSRDKKAAEAAADEVGPSQ